MQDRIQILEKYRKKALHALLFAIAVSVFIVIVLSAVMKDLQPAGFFLSLLLGTGSGLLLYYMAGCHRYLKEFKAYFKAVFVEEPFRSAFGQVVYKYGQGFDKERIDATDMILIGNRYYSNDYVQGFYKNVRFERADVKIQNHVSTGKTSYTVTYFNGRWLIFDFNKEFHFDLQIIGNGFEYAQKNKSIFTGAQDRRHKIELEDIIFNENFQVLGQDYHEAYYILTPHFMGVLKELYDTVDGALMLGFTDNRLHVAVNTKKDAMESSVFGSIEPDEAESDVQNEINTIMNLIDSLDLDRDIYKN
jgi:hypothetical protein